METKFLFPRQCKIVGWLIFIPALVTSVLLRISGFDFDDRGITNVIAVVNSDILSAAGFMTVIKNGIIDEVLLVLIIIGGLLVGFSKLRDEDELSAKIRYESLVWAVYVNFGVMLFATIFIYGTYYFDVLIANVFTMLFFFIVRFHVMLHKLKKSADDEE
jgi:hypothetical protein